MKTSAKKTSVQQNKKTINYKSFEEKTGKSWEEWFAILDKFDVKKNGHKAAAEFLYEKYSCPEWWCQTITVEYEKAKGLRVLNQTCTGDFAVSVSKTISTSLPHAYQAWMDNELRKKWMGNRKITIRKANENKNIRISWDEDSTNIEARFYEKGNGKCQVVADHRKLSSADDVESKRAFWNDALEKLKVLLEK